MPTKHDRNVLCNKMQPKMCRNDTNSSSGGCYIKEIEYMGVNNPAKMIYEGKCRVLFVVEDTLTFFFFLRPRHGGICDT